MHGYSYSHNIILNDIHPIYVMNWPNIGYELNFGDNCLNKLVKKYFEITNTCEDCIYKFEFDGIPDCISFSPKIGHLKAFNSKTVIASLFTNKPISYQNVCAKTLQHDFEITSVYCILGNNYIKFV